MSKQAADHNQRLIISYLTLRRAIGIVGILLPFVLWIGFKIFNKDCEPEALTETPPIFPPSISHFYYTKMGDLFVGTLCAVSLFMFCYNGHDKADKIAAKLASLFALGVAFFPTNVSAFKVFECNRISGDGEDVLSNIVHYVSAALLFSTLAFFCLFQFTK